VSTPIHYVHFKTGKGRSKSSFFPALDSEVIVCGMTKRVLRQTRPIAAHVSAAQVQDSDVETFNPPNLAFDIGNGGHGSVQSNPTPFSRKS